MHRRLLLLLLLWLLLLLLLWRLLYNCRLLRWKCLLLH